MTHKCSLSLIALFLILTPRLLAYDIEGIIKDYEGKPLADAMVRLLDNQRFERGKDFTDRNGTYQIHGLAAGMYTMEITKMGMKKVTEEVSVSGPYYDSTVYKDINLDEIVRFEGVKRSELKGLFIVDEETIPRGAFSCYRKGLKEMEKRDWDDAMEEFQEAVMKYPKFSRCYTHIADIYMLQRKMDLSEKNYLKAIELNKNDPFPRTGLGKLYIEKEEWQKALDQLSVATEMDPSRAENRFLYGKALYKLERYTDAERELMQGLMLQPRDSGDARISLANIYIHQERYTDARDMLKSYIRENPFAENKGEIQTRIKELDKQIALFTLPEME